MPIKTGNLVEPPFARRSTDVRGLRTVDLTTVRRMAILCLLGVLALLDRSVILRGQTIVPSDTTSPRATRQAPGIPRAVAQIDQVSGGVGALVQLDGSSSTDPDSLPLNYHWTLVQGPVGSAARLTGDASVNPSFIPDRRGEYLVQLVVDNAAQTSHPDVVQVTVPNTPPVAKAGRDRLAGVGDSVLLDAGESSDADGDPLTYQWAFVSRPAGSRTRLSAPDTSTPSLLADKPGRYVVRLVASDREDSSGDVVNVDIAERAPAANAGADQTAVVGALVALDGSGSADIDGHRLKYTWRFAARPEGSSATLSGRRSVRPSFVVDMPGDYVVDLVVDDNLTESAVDSVHISTRNSAPVADGGRDLTAREGQTVRLDGSGSSDVDGNPLTFSWTLVSKPSRSNAILGDSRAANPTLSVDRRGTYEVHLVVNDGSADSAADIVRVAVANTPPVSAAGFDQRVERGATVTLDGSASTDVDGNELTYAWALTTVPDGSAAVLSDAAAVSPTFKVDVSGTYIAQLLASDGTAISRPDTVVVTTDRVSPVANAGFGQTVRAGQVVLLNGSASSEGDGARLTYQWSLVSKPAGSAATLEAATTAGPSFTSDKAGDYIVQLIVNDGTSNSPPDTVVVTTKNSVPVSDAGKNQRDVPVASSVGLDASASFDADGQPLTYSWSLLARPAGSLAAISDPTGAAPTFAADVAGEYVAQLVVSDGVVDSVPDTVLIRTKGRPSDGGRTDRTVDSSATAQVDSGTSIGTAALPTVTVLSSDAAASEDGPNPGAFTVARTGDMAAALIVRFTLAGSAANGTDYTTLALAVSIAAGASSAVVRITPTADFLLEGSETVSLTLAAGDYTVGTPNRATVTIADGLLKNGATYRGSISRAGEIDAGRFTAAAGTSIIVSIGEVGVDSAFLPWIRLLDPNGVLVSAANNWGTLAAQFQVVAPLTGMYTVRVASADIGNNDTGTYLLTTVRVPGALTVAPGDQGGRLTNGGNHAGTIHVGDLDPWTVTAAAGESIVVSIGETGVASALVPWIRVFGPTGAPVFNGNNWGALAAQVQVTAPTAGIYTVVVSTQDVGNDASGTYVLTVVHPVGALTVSAGDQGGALTKGATHAGTIHAGDLDPWSFTTVAGQVISLTISDADVNTAFVPWIRVFGPTGAPVFNGNNWGDLGATVRVAAPATGKYTVVISTADSGNDATGRYLLTQK